MRVEVDAMADINLDFLSPEKREFLRRRAEQRGSTVEEELERAVGEIMERAEAEPEVRRPIDEIEDWHTPESLAEAREADRRLTEQMKGLASDGERPKDLSGLIGMFHGDGRVTGRNFHEYLYGREDDSR
jgi:hypothetical protein